MKSSKHYTYMLRCNDNTIYSGYAVDPIKRLKVHNSGKGAKYTRAHLPVELVYCEEFDNKSDALRRERELKKCTHSEKEKIIENYSKNKLRRFLRMIPEVYLIFKIFLFLLQLLKLM